MSNYVLLKNVNIKFLTSKKDGKQMILDDVYKISSWCQYCRRSKIMNRTCRKKVSWDLENKEKIFQYLVWRDVWTRTQRAAVATGLTYTGTVLGNDLFQNVYQ